MYPYNRVLLRNKKKWLLIHISTWMNLQSIVKKPDTKGYIHSVWFCLCDPLEKAKLRNGGQGIECRRAQGTFEGDRYVVYLVCGRSYMTVHTCQNSEYLKKVNLILCKLHFSKPDLEMKTYWMRFRDVFVVFK